MLRYYVCRHYIKWKGKLYKKGELLPENFTDHDRVRSIYSSRIARKKVVEEAPPSQPPQQPLSGQPTTPPESTSDPASEAPQEPQVPEKGAKEAKPKFTFTPTGTH
jgi:hypothetical protein